MDENFQKPDVSREQLETLMKTYQETVKRIRKGDDSGVASDYDPDFDSKSIWFPRKAVEALFNDNNADGLRIYFGVHNADVMPTPYDDRLTVVLVATKYEDGRNVDQLKSDGDAKDDEEGGPGYGLNHGKVCPPYCD
ncbi:hypothetical protein LJ707_16340 [Mucilaginibacter sp. UR6-1]|uniref:hypothetical protein n=1 Tax=Mucilaginibacter sp. UR6-1 TaxID=1435643 RepID=UPI001E498240|nr:hypothetical protein [Mucilaginibacter sp. UR6-1]MCC8410513.1 hypothetical protein [Mucilaginibacter sp. UR6-1]